jgi:hypothetical protein
MQSWLASRYSSAYRIARFTVFVGKLVRIVSLVLAALVVLVPVLAAVTGNTGFDNVTIIRLFAGVLSAALFLASGFIIGTCIMAAGQTSMALLDIAVNTSLFATPEEKASIMNTTVA